VAPHTPSRRARWTQPRALQVERATTNRADEPQGPRWRGKTTPGQKLSASGLEFLEPLYGIEP